VYVDTGRQGCCPRAPQTLQCSVFGLLGGAGLTLVCRFCQATVKRGVQARGALPRLYKHHQPNPSHHPGQPSKRRARRGRAAGQDRSVWEGMGRPPCCERSGVKKGPWSPEEDLLLVSYVQEHGPENWRAVPSSTGTTLCSEFVFVSF